MKEREPLNLASTCRAPPVGRPSTILGGGFFNRNYGEISTGVDTEALTAHEPLNGIAAKAAITMSPHSPTRAGKR